MKSIERRFKKINDLNPDWSSGTCFAVAIMSQNFSRQTILNGFNKLVEKDDYDKRDKKDITAFFLTLSKIAEEIPKSTQTGNLKDGFIRDEEYDLEENQSP
jgi:hypothetical protein